MPQKRILSLWFPRLAAERVMRLERGLPAGPLAVVADQRGAHRHAGQLGGLLVATDRIKVATKARVLRGHIHHEGQPTEDERGQG